MNEEDRKKALNDATDAETVRIRDAMIRMVKVGDELKELRPTLVGRIEFMDKYLKSLEEEK